MPYSENISMSSFGVVDYNDLDMTLPRDTSPSKQNLDNFKFSLNSIDESELDDFRRSLVTPMSVNNVQDPMYAEFEKSKEAHEKYMMANILKKPTTLSPTHSYAGSIADSLAVFNRLIDDHSSEDFIRGDLNDFMSPYNMDDLISLPQSRSPTIPSPQIGRATFARYNSVAPIGSKGNQTMAVTNNTYLKPRKVSIDASVQTPSCFDNNKTASPNRSSSKERSSNTQHPKQEPIKTLQPKQTDKRRWSSYVPDKIEKPATSKLAQLGNRNRLSTVNKPHTNPGTEKSSHVAQMNRAPLLSGMKSRPETKRNSTAGVHNALRKNSQEELKHVSTTHHVRHTDPIRASDDLPESYEQQHHHDEAASNMYLQRRLSLMTDTDEPSNPAAEDQHHKSEIPVTRYSYIRLSTRTNPTDQLNARTIFSSRSKIAEPKHDTTLTKPTDQLNARTIFNYRSKIAELKHDTTPTKSTHIGQRTLSTRTKAADIKPAKDIVSKPVKTDQRSIFVSRSKLTDTKPIKESISKPLKPDQPQRSILSSRSRVAETKSTKDILKPTVTEQPERSIFRSQRRLQRRLQRPDDNDLISSKVHDINVNRGHVDQHKHGSNDTSKRVSYREPTADKPSYSVSKRLSSSALPTLSVPASTPRAAPTISTQLRRARSLTAPSSRYGYREPDTYVSSMPVPVFRHRKQASKYAPVPEDQVAPATKVRFSFSSRRDSNEIQPVASASSSGYSNATTSSSRSDDTDSTPSTPPSYGIDTRFDRRRSIPSKEDRGYKVVYEPSSYRRQRVVSEDNRQYKDQQRKCVTESAREVLALVQERRARNAILLNK